MTSKIILSLFSFIAIYSMFSCTKEGDPGPPGPPGDTGVYLSLKGNITGKVIVYDTLGRALADHSGVVVIIDSTGLADTTDASGAYSFSDVPAGRYNFSYIKEGYGTYRIIRQLHPGGPQATKLADADVGQIYNGPPVTLFVLFGYGSPDNPRITQYVEFESQIRKPVATVLYIDTSAAPSKTKFKTNIRYYSTWDAYEAWYETPEIDPEIIRSDSSLINARTLYFFLAFDNLRNIHYRDEQGRTVYPCTGQQLGAFTLSGSTFIRTPFSARKTDDWIYPQLRRFRLK
ncbi:carboxypeptidase-like regulatory domain-containing protein [Chitinophaga sp. S165]|uniref:carboxypeptidase-like regulatory domain-containing protein n=1 Tax=Chitinophaga sp. S165 TaxID=2135462 RepID=UPI000D71BEFB|nr:carboxypeptidase-like regulatory domain-containing protein [Chitinophaga sp. S165]PWV48155.1 carboxypeptidase family protein [Chitinophaga sp. S165]